MQSTASISSVLDKRRFLAGTGFGPDAKTRTQPQTTPDIPDTRQQTKNR